QVAGRSNVLLSETAKANSSSCSNPNCMIVAIRHRSLLEAFTLFIIAYLTDTVVRNFRYQRSNSHPRGARSGCDPDCGVGAVPACGLASRARAASGIMSAGITAGARGASAGLGQAQGGERRRGPRPRKPGPKLRQDKTW